MVPKDTNKTPKWDPWAPKVLQSGAKWDPKGAKSVPPKCKKSHLGKPWGAQGHQNGAQGCQNVPWVPKMKVLGSKPAPKMCARIGTISKKLGHPVLFFKQFLLKYIRQSTEPGARKTKKLGHSVLFFMFFLSHTIRHSTATRIGGTGRKAITIIWCYACQSRCSVHLFYYLFQSFSICWLRMAQTHSGAALVHITFFRRTHPRHP